MNEKRGGYLKLWRSIVTWQWYGDVHVTRLFIHLVMTCNYERRQWRGMTIEPGQLVTSIAQLTAETNLTTQQVRTALAKLASTHDIVDRSTKLGRVISLRRWAFWQSDAPDQQRINKANNKEINRSSNKGINKGVSVGNQLMARLSEDDEKNVTKLPTKGSTDRSTDRDD